MDCMLMNIMVNAASVLLEVIVRLYEFLNKYI